MATPGSNGADTPDDHSAAARAAEADAPPFYTWKKIYAFVVVVLAVQVVIYAVITQITK